jgi:hypothetical protein
VLPHSRPRSCRRSLIYLFGNQGLLKGLMFGEGTIYGRMASSWRNVLLLPHALIIAVTALAAPTRGSTGRRRSARVSASSAP